MAQQNDRILGIIGGAGVGAAAQLYIDVAARFRAATTRLPQIALWNIPLSDDLERSFLGGGADASAAAAAEALVAQAVDRLVDAGATVIAMPCNSLQRVAARESERAGLPFVDMIGATVEAVRALEYREAVLLATSTTYAAGHYDGHGVEMAPPPPDQLAELAALISRLGTGRPPTTRELLDLIERVRRPGACVVLGCTDICGLIDPDTAAAAAVVESLACLADVAAEALGARAGREPRLTPERESSVP
jgi:aspartate racemase